MGKIDQNKLGLAVGGFFGAWHVVWAAMVSFGWAQPTAKFFFNLHFLNVPFTFRPFDMTTAIELVVVAAVVGYAAAWIFGAIWNAVLKR